MESEKDLPDIDAIIDEFIREQEIIDESNDYTLEFDDGLEVLEFTYEEED